MKAQNVFSLGPFKLFNCKQWNRTVAARIAIQLF